MGFADLKKNRSSMMDKMLSTAKSAGGEKKDE